jgi:DNA-directed RNA polymerase subunit RPC12/RpoP
MPWAAPETGNKRGFIGAERECYMTITYQYYCANCQHAITLDVHGRCEDCQSEALIEEPGSYRRVYLPTARPISKQELLFGLIFCGLTILVTLAIWCIWA